MDIKKVKKTYRSEILSALTIITLLVSFSMFSTTIPISNTMDPMMSSGPYLVNKVYNFTTSRDYVNFSKNIYFEKPYIYDISFEIVTPHTCHMNISLWDPVNDKYDIYDSRPGNDTLGQFQPEEIPFGVAITGNYTLTFQAHLDQNLNIHIKIINSGLKCLQDALPPTTFSHLDLYKVNKFYKGTTILYNISLKTDVLYRFYFGRYSPIAYESKKYTIIDFNITSSIDIEYTIYINESLPHVCIIESFDFGTAVEGLYNITMTIYCRVLCVNIAYGIIEVEKIADETDPNDPEPLPDPPNNNTRTGIEYNMPVEWTIGIIIFLGAMVCVPILIVVNRKKKNATGI